MDAFQIIQHFFSRMTCQHCDLAFSKDDVELLKQDDNVFVVNVYCHKCDTQNGVALVGLDVANIGDMDETDLEYADFDAEFETALESEAAALSDSLSEAIRSVPGRMVVPEEILMQLLEQTGSLPSGLPKGKKNRFKDPELTQAERARLAKFKQIKEDDVLDAHNFIQDLGNDWMKFIPEEMRQSQTVPHTESPSD